MAGGSLAERQDTHQHGEALRWAIQLWLRHSVLLSFAKISSHSVDDGPCLRDRAKARPGTLDSESEIARPTAWAATPRPGVAPVRWTVNCFRDRHRALSEGG